MRHAKGSRTALFTCELRRDPGFAAPLLAIADELVRLEAEAGHELRTVFALSDPIYYGDEVASHGHMVVPAPVAQGSLEINSLARSYANVLAGIGFGQERQLRLFLGTWDRLFAVLSPSVVIADNSPSACLAARGRIPLLIAGSGFSAPPIDTPAFPAIAGDVHAEISQTLIRDVVNRVLKDRRVKGIERLPEFLAGDRRAVFSVPQLDPYYAHRKEPVLSPCMDLEGPLPPREQPSIFFALPSTFPGLTKIVRALQQAGTDMSCYAVGPQTVGLTLLNEIGARNFEARPSLHDALSGATAVLAASADLAASAYVAGRPQVVLRYDLETSVMAAELENRHTAIALDVTDTDKLTDAIRDVVNSSTYVQSAREEARRLQITAPQGRSVNIAARACLELLDRSA